MLDTGSRHGQAIARQLLDLGFEPDDEGYSVLLVEGEIPAELEDAARLAADNCPEYAITCHPAQS